MREDIIAILPEHKAGFGIGSRVYGVSSSEFDPKTPTHLLERMYQTRGKSKKFVDRYIKSRIQLGRNYPYIIDCDQVFFAFKARIEAFDYKARGFVNVKYVEKIEDSCILLLTGERLDTLSSEKVLVANRNNALIFYYEEMIKAMDASRTAVSFVKKKFMD